MDRGIPVRARLGRRDALVALGIAVVAFALRLVFLFHSPDRAWPHSVLYEGDAPVWARWATALDHAQPFEYDLAFRTPGVAWLLHALGLSTAPFTAAKLLWCAISAATPAVLYLVAARFLNRRVALVAALLCVLSYGSFALATSINNETPYALLVVLIVGVTLDWSERPTWMNSIGLGLLHAAALLLRAEHILLLALLLPWAALKAWRKAAGAGRLIGWSTLVLATTLLLCAPWSLKTHAATRRFNHEAAPLPYANAQPPWTPSARAYLERLPAFARAGNFAFLSELARRGGARAVDETDVRAFFERQWGYVPEPLGEWSLVSSKGALDFALANHPDAGGGFSRAALQDGRDSVAEFSFGRPSHLRLVNHGYAIGWGFIRADFGAFGLLVREKLARFADGATLGLFAHDWPHAASRQRYAVDLATAQREEAPLWRISCLGMLAVGALLACRRRGATIWVVIVAYKLAVVIAFYGYARQAVSIAPVLFVLLALPIDAMSNRFDKRAWTQARGLRWSAWAAAGTLLLIAAWSAANSPTWTVQTMRADAVIRPAPQWGFGAFESNDDLHLRSTQAQGKADD